MRETWKFFTWNLASLNEESVPLPHGLLLRTGSRADEAPVAALVERSFTTDSQWTGSYSRIAEPLSQRIHEAFRSQSSPALVILHGPRIIAASVFSTDLDADNHLFCGPCVLPEYRSRRIGSALLLESLLTLRNLGARVARAVCKEGTTASKFVYPKFGAVVETYESEPFELIR